MFTKIRMHKLFARPLTSIVLVLAGAVPAASALELTEAELFIELNDTDGDLGLHASIDGGPYSRLAIEDPRDNAILKVNARGRLSNQGLTQLFMESAEPTFDELGPGWRLEPWGGDSQRAGGNPCVT